MVRQDHTRSSLKSTITSFSLFNRPIFYNIQFFTLLLTWRIVCTMLQLYILFEAFHDICQDVVNFFNHFKTFVQYM